MSILEKTCLEKIRKTRLAAFCLLCFGALILTQPTSASSLGACADAALPDLGSVIRDRSGERESRFRLDLPGPGIVTLTAAGAVLSLEPCDGSAFEETGILLEASATRRIFAVRESGGWLVRAVAGQDVPFPERQVTSRFLDADVRTEEVALVIAPGLEIRGRRTTFDVTVSQDIGHRSLSAKAENHEVDPDPIRFHPGPGSLVSVLDIEGVGLQGEALPPLHILLMPSVETSPGITGKAENHEVDPDPLYAAPEASLWQARKRSTESSRQWITFRVLNGLFGSPAEPGGLDAFLAWTAVWLWPDAFAGEVARPHDGRFRLVTFRSVEDLEFR